MASGRAQRQAAGSPYAKTPQRQQHPPANPRIVKRDGWARAWGGPHHLDGGISNRHVLSLRSTLPSEIDWSLERLVQVSGIDPELLRLAEYPGLLEGLLVVIREWLDQRAAERRSAEVALHRAWGDARKEIGTRRATEAALVLRNLATDSGNVQALVASRKLLGVVVDGLDEGNAGDAYAEESTELRLYLLDILEAIADHVSLALPGRARPSGAPPSTSPSTRLYPLLIPLTRSSDRAFVLASFRVLTALSTKDSNDAVLALITYTNIEPPLSPLPHPIQTAIELLSVADTDLSLVLLDFIYQHTLLPSNAALFAARPDLTRVLKVVASKRHFGSKRESVEHVVPMKGSEAEMEHLARLPPKPTPRPVPELSVKMSPGELQELLKLQEPLRALTWMRTAFEGYATGEITQVALWTAYRAEFEAYNNPPERTLLPAAEVIKMSTDAFPQALPMVLEVPEKKFIIRGIRIRDRTDMKQIFACRWRGCTSPHGPTSAESLYWHLHHTHLNNSSPPTRCEWAACAHVASPTSASPTTPIDDLSLHVRTHMPVYYPPPGYGDAVADPPPPPDPTYTTKYLRYHAELDETSEVTGLGFLSCLVLRNVARTVKIALGNPAGGASVDSLTGGEESIFEAFEAAAEGGAKKDDVASRLDKVDYSDARRGGEALLSLEDVLVETILEDLHLGKILGEVVAVIVDVAKARK